jgi:hypothetical protein
MWWSRDSTGDLWPAKSLTLFKETVYFYLRQRVTLKMFSLQTDTRKGRLWSREAMSLEDSENFKRNKNVLKCEVLHLAVKTDSDDLEK